MLTDGETEALGERLKETLADGLMLAEGDNEADIEALGEMLADGDTLAPSVTTQ